MIELLSRLSHDSDTDVAQVATFSMGLAAAGTNNARAAQLLRQLSVYFSKDPQCLFVVRLAQGLCHMGKGLLGVHPFHSDRLLLHPAALGGVLTVCHCCLDMKGLILGKYHYLLFFLAPAIHPRFLVTVDEGLNTLPITVRVGQAVDSVAQAGVPKTITGAQTHTTPVLLATNQRAEIADKDVYEALTPVLEGFVVVQKKPADEEGKEGGEAMQQ